MPGVNAAIDAGAHLEAKNSAGKTPADVAVDKGHFIIAHFLLSERGKSAGAIRPKRRVPTVTAKPRPKPRAPKDTATATTAKSTPESTAGLTHGGKYGYPPRRPLDPMVSETLPEAVEISESPGLRTGRAEPGADPFKSPKPVSEEPATDKAATENLTAKPESSPPETLAKAADEGKSAGAVSRFFQSLVDIVTPSAPISTKPIAAQTTVEPAADTLAKTETVEPEINPDAMIVKDILETPGLPVLEAPADAPKVVRKVAPAQPVTKRVAARRSETAETPSATSASRALTRLKGLVEDAPEEDAFGLPKLAAPEPSQRSAAPPIQASDLAEDNILNPTESDDVVGTLERLRAALSRDITTNPLEILKASRLAGAKRMEQLLDQIKTVPPEITALRTPEPAPTQPSPIQPPKKKSIESFINDLADIRREPPPSVAPEKPIEKPAAFARPRMESVRAPETAEPPSTGHPLTDTLPEIKPTEKQPTTESDLGVMLKKDAPSVEPAEQTKQSEPAEPESQTLNFEDRVTRIKRRAYAEEDMLRKAAEDAAKKTKAAGDAKVENTESDEQKKSETVDALARYFKDKPRAKIRDGGVSAQDYRTAPDIGVINEPPGPTGNSVAPKAVAALDEPPPGQTAGKMNPGFLDKLARLFSNEETGDTGWSAQVQVDDPTPPTDPAVGGGMLSQQLPAEAATGWTTSVELNAGGGNSVLLGVTKTPSDRPAETPVDRIEPAQPPPETAQAQFAATEQPISPEPEPRQMNEAPMQPAIAEPPTEQNQKLAQLEEPPAAVAEPEANPQPITEGSILEQIEARLRKREGLPALEPTALGNRFGSGLADPVPAAADELDADLSQLDQLTPPTDSLDAKLGTLDEPTKKLDDSLDAAFGEPTTTAAPADESLDAAFGEPADKPVGEAAAAEKPGASKRARRSAPPTFPYSDPLRAPDASVAKSAPPPPPPQITRAMPLRQPSAAEEAAQRATRLERQEALATGYPTLGQVAASQQASAPQMWPVTELAKNDRPTRPARPA